MKYLIDKERIHLMTPTPGIQLAVHLENVDANRLSDAVKTAYAAHGLFGTRVRTDEKGRAWFEPFEGACPSIEIAPCADEDVWTRAMAEEIPRPFHIREGEWLRMKILTHPDQSAVWLMSAHHLIGDGIALMNFAQNALEAYAGRALPEALRHIRLFTPELIPRAAKLPRNVAIPALIIRASWRKILYSPEKYEAMRSMYWRERNICVYRARFSPEKLNALVAKCRENQTTIASLVASAFAKARGETSKIGVAMSIRPEDWQGLGNYATGITIQSASPETEIWEGARAAKKQMAEIAGNPARKYFLVNFMRALPPTLIDAAYFSAFGGEPNHLAAKAAAMFGFAGDREAFALSNLSKRFMEEDYAGARATGVDFLPPPAPNAENVVGVATAGGAMTITMQRENGGDEGRQLFDRAISALEEAAL